MAIRGGGAGVPEVARDELVDRHTLLYDLLVAEVADNRIANHVSLQVCEGPHGRSATVPLEPGLLAIAGQVEAEGLAGVVESALRIEPVRLAEDRIVQGHLRHVASGAADRAEGGLSGRDGRGPDRIGSLHAPGSVQRGLVERN